MSGETIALTVAHAPRNVGTTRLARGGQTPSCLNLHRLSHCGYRTLPPVLAKHRLMTGTCSVKPYDINVLGQRRRLALMQMIPNQAAHKTCGNPAVRQVEIPDYSQGVHADGIFSNQIPQLRFLIHLFQSNDHGCESLSVVSVSARSLVLNDECRRTFRDRANCRPLLKP